MTNKYKQIDNQNIINLCREFGLALEEVTPMYMEEVSRVKANAAGEYNPFEPYRNARDILKNQARK